MSGFPVFPRLIDFVTSGPSLALVLEGRNAVAVWRSMAGPTNAKSAKFEAPESLRARYGQDAQMNAVHASYDLREARQSIEAVFYGMLEGQFRVMQPEDDPLSVGMSPKQTPVAQVAEEAFVEEPAVEVAQDAAEPSEAIEEDLGEQQPPCAAVEETCLVSQMETLAVSAALQNDITEEMLEPKKENAEDEEPQAVDVVQIAANQLSPPQTPPQTKVPVGDKAHPLGSRLASSPFLKADRQLGNEAPSATKKVGRIKSPFLGNGHDETAGATLGAEAHAESERSAFEPTQVPTDQDGTKLRERLEGLCLNSSAQAEELAGEEEAASMDAAAQREPEAAAEAPEVPISSEAAAAPEQPAENAKAPEAANGTPRPTRPGQQTGPTPSKTPAQPLRGTQTRGAVPAQTASSARATATRAVPASAMAQRTVRRVGPAAGPASGASPSAPAGSRRVTLGPAPVASRPRVSPAAPATPSVTTRAAARAAGPTPLAARSTPSVARATPSKAPVPVASRTVPPKPADDTVQTTGPSGLAADGIQGGSAGFSCARFSSADSRGQAGGCGRCGSLAAAYHTVNGFHSGPRHVDRILAGTRGGGGGCARRQSGRSSAGRAVDGRQSLGRAGHVAAARPLALRRDTCEADGGGYRPSGVPASAWQRSQAPMLFDPTQCAEVPSAQNAVLTALLCAGTFLSYLPQHIKILRRRSSDGISPYFILLGAVGAGSNITNIILLQFIALQCCTVQTYGECAASVLGILQVVIQGTMFYVTFVLYLAFFPAQSKYEGAAGGETRPLLGAGTRVRASEEWRTALWVAGGVAAHGAACVGMSVLLVAGAGPYAAPTRTWASLLGLFSLCLTCLQFFPQIVKTWRAGHVGALSIPMMLMQTPGGFVFAYSIAIRPGVNWSSWISTFVAASLQCVLLAICLTFDARARRQLAAERSAAAAPPENAQE
ncbi:hypothetical protein GGI02_002824 [Coemansia sp. RSA 2322]|nr:hypothetical protein GGI02_002824 [Coemansia sp. RSA 2322]